MLLKTPKDTLSSILKKEDLERKMIEMSGESKKGNRYVVGNDHLPFSNLIGKIASELPDAPKIPSFNITMTYEYDYAEIIYFLGTLDHT